MRWTMAVQTAQPGLCVHQCFQYSLGCLLTVETETVGSHSPDTQRTITKEHFPH